MCLWSADVSSLISFRLLQFIHRYIVCFSTYFYTFTRYCRIRWTCVWFDQLLWALLPPCGREALWQLWNWWIIVSLSAKLLTFAPLLISWSCFLSRRCNLTHTHTHCDGTRYKHARAHTHPHSPQTLRSGIYTFTVPPPSLSFFLPFHPSLTLFCSLSCFLPAHIVHISSGKWLLIDRSFKKMKKKY